jgi:hypothetical protein
MTLKSHRRPGGKLFPVLVIGGILLAILGIGWLVYSGLTPSLPRAGQLDVSIHRPERLMPQSLPEPPPLRPAPMPASPQ